MMQCAVLNSDTSRLNIIVLAIADIVLLLTVLIGLFRLRSNEGGPFGIGHLLWKQVGLRSYPFFVILPVN
jgi:hypothetical protein